MRAGLGRFLRLGTACTVAAVLAMLIAAPGPAAQDAGRAASKTAAGASRVEPVDLNAATQKDLEKVPGIGPALAKRIVEFRRQHGPFRRVEDVLKIRGIGEKSLQKMRPYLKVSAVK